MSRRGKSRLVGRFEADETIGLQIDEFAASKMSLQTDNGTLNNGTFSFRAGRNSANAQPIMITDPRDATHAPLTIAGAGSTLCTQALNRVLPEYFEAEVSGSSGSPSIDCVLVLRPR